MKHMKTNGLVTRYELFIHFNIHLFTYVYPCLFVFSYVYSCLPMLTLFYLRLSLFNRV